LAEVIPSLNSKSPNIKQIFFTKETFLDMLSKKVCRKKRESYSNKCWCLAILLLL
jgi:hypothetical protein